MTPPAVRQPLHARQHGLAAINPASAAPRAQLLDSGTAPSPDTAIHGERGESLTSASAEPQPVLPHLFCLEEHSSSFLGTSCPLGRTGIFAARCWYLLLSPAALSEVPAHGCLPQPCGKLAAACCSQPLPGATHATLLSSTRMKSSPLSLAEREQMGLVASAAAAAPARVSPPRCPSKQSLIPFPNPKLLCQAVLKCISHQKTPSY